MTSPSTQTAHPDPSLPATTATAEACTLQIGPLHVQVGRPVGNYVRWHLERWRENLDNQDSIDSACSVDLPLIHDLAVRSDLPVHLRTDLMRGAAQNLSDLYLQRCTEVLLAGLRMPEAAVQYEALSGLEDLWYGGELNALPDVPAAVRDVLACGVLCVPVLAWLKHLARRETAVQAGPGTGMMDGAGPGQTLNRRRTP